MDNFLNLELMIEIFYKCLEVFKYLVFIIFRSRMERFYFIFINEDIEV